MLSFFLMWPRVRPCPQTAYSACLFSLVSQVCVCRLDFVGAPSHFFLHAVVFLDETCESTVPIFLRFVDYTFSVLYSSYLELCAVWGRVWKTTTRPGFKSRSLIPVALPRPSSFTTSLCNKWVRL